MKSKKAPYLMILPYFVIYFAFSVFPLIFSLVISFTDWNGISQMSFVGLSNYIRAFSTDIFFVKSLSNTLILLLMITPLQIFLSLLMACLLKDFFFGRARRALQLVNFLPYITTSVAVGLIFQLLFEWKSGTVNGIIDLFGGTKLYWLGVPWLSRIVVSIMEVWKQYGYFMIMFLSGLSTIPGELYEAAKIDGARWHQSFWRITLPMLRPIFTFCVTTSMVIAFNLFDGPQLLFSGSVQPMGGPDRSVLTMVMHFYQTSFISFDLGYGSALAYILFLVTSVISLVTVNLLNREKGTRRGRR